MLQEQQSRGNPAQLTFDILTGTGTMAETAAQTQGVTPPMLHGVKQVALNAWSEVDSSLSDGSFVKIFQGPNEEYAQFLGKLKDAIEKSIRDANVQQMILKKLAFENADEDCQNVIRPIRETGPIMDYLKICRNIDSIRHRAQVAAMETYAIQKSMNVKCFNCGKPGHMKKQCRLPVNSSLTASTNKKGKPPGPCP